MVWLMLTSDVILCGEHAMNDMRSTINSEATANPFGANSFIEKKARIVGVTGTRTLKITALRIFLLEALKSTVRDPAFG